MQISAVALMKNEGLRFLSCLCHRDAKLEPDNASIIHRYTLLSTTFVRKLAVSSL